MLKISHDFQKLAISLQAKEKQLRFATAVALTRTATTAVADAKREINTRMDRPTPYTLRSVKYKRATRDDLSALVYVEGADRLGGNVDYSPADLLAHQFFSGGRKTKRPELYLQRTGLLGSGEYVVPGAGAKLDRFGNMSRGQVQQIISQLKAGLDPASQASRSARSRRNVKKAGRIFWSRGSGHLPRGAWIDQGQPVGLRPLLVVIKPPRYRRSVDFIGSVQRTVGREFDRQFSIAVKQAFATAR